jgi:hypothetical protein
MSQTLENNKTGFENSSVIYQANRSATEDEYDTYAQNRLRARIDPVIISNDVNNSFWKSPDEVEGAVKVNHKYPGWLARGEQRDSLGNPIPTWDERIVKTKEFIAANKLAVAGQDAPHNWGFSDEWYPKAFELIAVAGRARKEGRPLRTALAEAGIIDSTAYPTLERINTQIAVEQAESVTHIFRQVCTLETTDMLDIEKIFTFTGPGISRHTLGDYRVPYPKKGSFTEVEIEELDKDMAHVAWSEEFFLKTYEANIRELNLASIPFQMEKSKQYKIAVVIDAISGTAKASWSAMTGADSTRNPYPDIDDVVEDIVDEDGSGDTFVSNNGVYHAWLHNTFVTGLSRGTGGEPFGSIISTNRVVGGAEGVPGGLRWGIDSAMPDGTLAIYDRRAVRFRQGPQNVRDYTDVKTGVTGRIWKDFNLSYNWRTAWTERLTGLV